MMRSQNVDESVEVQPVAVDDLGLQTISEKSPLSNNKKKKKVKFDTSVRVVLIPTVEEYKKAELGHLLWWDSADYIVFKESALEELKHYLFHHPLLNTKTAIFELYQKGNIETPSPSSPASECKDNLARRSKSP